jgi:hypothetical protein
MKKEIGINEFKKLYFGLGGEKLWEGVLRRFSDKRKEGRRIKFRVYNKCRNEGLIKNVVNELNEIDGGGWEYMRLGGNREYKMNLEVYWDIKKFYKKLDN